MSRRVILHIGFPKCGSTSLQQALSNHDRITFPRSGSHQNEHIALPLGLKGIDQWTSQWFSQSWLDRELKKLLAEVRDADGTVAMSSERLASLSDREVEELGELFVGEAVTIVCIQRDRDRFLDSMWRHAVYRHDFAESHPQFLDRMAGFRFDGIASAFSQLFDFHLLDMDDEQFVPKLSEIYGEPIAFSHENPGIPRDLAELLQKSHVLMGSAAFKAAFPPARKESMLRAYKGEHTPAIDDLDVRLFS